MRRLSEWRSAVALLLAFTTVLVRAVELGGSAPDYIVTQWDTEKGLPHNAVKAIHQAKDGYLWVSTDDGVARFDGIRFTNYNEASTSGVLNGLVTAFAETEDGSLWLATTTGLVRYFQGRFSRFGDAEGVRTSTGIVNALCVDSDGVLWVGTLDGITRWRNGEFVHDIDTSGLDMRGTRSLQADRNGAVWVSVSNAVLRYEHGVFTRFAEAQGLPKYITTVSADAGGRVLAVTHSGLFVLSGDRFIPFDRNAQLTNISVNDARVDRAGTLWIGTIGGLDRKTKSEDTVSACPDQSGNSIGVVYAIFEDQEDCIWVGTANGLYRFTRARGYSFAAGERRSRVAGQAVVAARDGALWLSSYGYGVDRLKDGVVTHFRAGAPLSHDIVKCIHEAPDGSMWFGTRGSTIDHLQDGKVTTYVYEPGVTTSRFVSAVYVADDGTVLLGISRRGLLQLRGGQVVPVEEAAELASDTVWTIQREGAGRLLIGTSRGLFERTAENRWVAVPMKGMASPAVVRSILEGQGGTLWLATDGQGLVRWREGTARAYGTEAGLIDENLFSVVRDDLGNLWVGSTKGIMRIREGEFEDLDRGRIAAVNCTTFGRADGLLSGSSAGAGYPASAVLEDGRLINGTDRGFAVVAPLGIKTNTRPPNVVIESVRADDMPLPLGEKVLVPAGTNRVDLRFTALSLVAPERVRFRYQLKGSDRAWVEAEYQRMATYTHLAPGTYTFRVLACNNDGIWNEVGAAQKIEILPRFYQTLLFRIAVLIAAVSAIAGIVWAVVHRRVQERMRRLERQHAIDKERNRIARDLHDELGAGLTELGLLSDELAESAPRELSRQLSRLALRTRRLGADLSGIVWTMNVTQSSLKDLAEFIQRYSDRLFRKTGARCLVSGIDAIPPLPLSPTTRHEVLAAVKEALNNTIKHAEATEAHIRLRYTDGRFEVEVADNGRGFELTSVDEATSDGNGLRNMRSRLHEVGGAMSVESAPGKGTRIVFCVPCESDLRNVADRCRSK